MAPIPPNGDESGKVDVHPEDVNSAATTFAQQQSALEKALEHAGRRFASQRGHGRRRRRRAELRGPLRRDFSKSGGKTIDINVDGVRTTKIHIG